MYDMYDIILLYQVISVDRWLPARYMTLNVYKGTTYCCIPGESRKTFPPVKNDGRLRKKKKEEKRKKRIESNRYLRHLYFTFGQLVLKVSGRKKSPGNSKKQKWVTMLMAGLLLAINRGGRLMFLPRMELPRAGMKQKKKCNHQVLRSK